MVQVRIPRSKLKPLTGTPKQVAWATDLREKAITAREQEYQEAAARAARTGKPMPTQDEIDAALAKVAESFNAHTDARWWIDQRL